MKALYIKLLKLMITATVLQVFTVQASLLISPMSITFTDRDRSAQVVIINTSTVTRNYRIEWSQKKAVVGGGYEELTPEESKSFHTASSMLRVSPKQVRLAPGERQTVKIAARKPKDLADGDYRSHLKFTALPEQSAPAEGEPGSIKIKVLLSYSIPVIVRKGAEKYEVTIDSVKIEPRTNTVKTKTSPPGDLLVTISRLGPTTMHGSINAYWQADGDHEEVLVGILNHARLYSELSQSHYKLFWQGSELPKSGKLRVVYSGDKEFRGKIFAEKVIKL
jgi:fimbrial chaperone protein